MGHCEVRNEIIIACHLSSAVSITALSDFHFSIYFTLIPICQRRSDQLEQRVILTGSEGGGLLPQPRVPRKLQMRQAFISAQGDGGANHLNHQTIPCLSFQAALKKIKQSFSHFLLFPSFNYFCWYKMKEGGDLNRSFIQQIYFMTPKVSFQHCNWLGKLTEHTQCVNYKFNLFLENLVLFLWLKRIFGSYPL